MGVRQTIRAIRGGLKREDAMADKLLDTKGLNCPLPILKVKKALGKVPVGGTLEVLATDPGAESDFEAFCRQTKNELVERSTDAGVYRFVIRRTA